MDLDEQGEGSMNECAGMSICFSNFQAAYVRDGSSRTDNSSAGEFKFSSSTSTRQSSDDIDGMMCASYPEPDIGQKRASPWGQSGASTAFSSIDIDMGNMNPPGTNHAQPTCLSSSLLCPHTSRLSPVSALKRDFGASCSMGWSMGQQTESSKKQPRTTSTCSPHEVPLPKDQQAERAYPLVAADAAASAFGPWSYYSSNGSNGSNGSNVSSRPVTPAIPVVDAQGPGVQDEGGGEGYLLVRTPTGREVTLLFPQHTADVAAHEVFSLLEEVIGDLSVSKASLTLLLRTCSGASVSPSAGAGAIARTLPCSAAPCQSTSTLPGTSEGGAVAPGVRARPGSSAGTGALVKLDPSDRVSSGSYLFVLQTLFR